MLKGLLLSFQALYQKCNAVSGELQSKCTTYEADFVIHILVGLSI